MLRTSPLPPSPSKLVKSGTYQTLRSQSYYPIGADIFLICALENLENLTIFWSFQGLQKRNIDSKQAIYRIAEKLSQAGKKRTKYWFGVKSFYSNRFYSCEYKENWVIKLSIKMFIKRKTRAGKAYSHQMLLSFKTSVIIYF